MAVRVLLVEDNEVYRSTLELLLDGRDGTRDRRLGRRRRASGRRRGRSSSPDVVLMDFRLPGLDGAEATAAVRARTPQAAVLCLTAEATDADREAVLAAGAVGPDREGQLDRGARRGRSIQQRDEGTRIREPDSREHRDRARLDLRLPRRAGALPEHARRAALRQLRRRELPRPRRHRLPRLLRAPARRRRRCRRRRSRRRRTSSTSYEELAGYERIYALQLSAKLSGTYQSAVTAAERGRRRPDPRRRHRDGVARRRAARARDPAPPRRGARPTRRSRR